MHKIEAEQPPIPRVLIVDDNRAFRVLIRSHLSKVSGTIHECKNGSEAVVEYLKKPFDLVIMDVDMPIMDGITATQKIRAVDPRATVVIQTSHKSEELHTRAIAAGAYTLIDKAFLQTIPEIIEPLLFEKLG